VRDTGYGCQLGTSLLFLNPHIPLSTDMEDLFKKGGLDKALRLAKHYFGQQMAQKL
jgi:hypothetical protein